MRIGHVGAGHADHVELARRNGMARGRDIGDARGMEGRHADLGPDAAREIEMRRRFHALHRDHVGQRRVGLDMATDDVQEIDIARRLEHVAERDPLVGGQAALHRLVGGVADADQQLFAHPRANGRDDIEREAGAAVERSGAIGSVELVGRGRQELVHQVAVAFQLDPIESGLGHALGGIGIVADDAGDVPVFDLLREGAVGRFALVRRGHRRQPVALVPVRAAAKMGQLDHHRAAVAVAFVGQLAHPAHHLVPVGEHVVEDRRAVLRHGGGPRRHGHGDAGLGALDMIGAVAVLRHAVFRIGRLMRGRHDPVLQRQVLQLVGLQKRIVRGHETLPGRGRGMPPARWNRFYARAFMLDSLKSTHVSISFDNDGNNAFNRGHGRR